MLKRLITFLVVCLSFLVMTGTAMAVPYPLQFDPDPSSDTYYSPQVIWGWDMEAISKESVPAPNGTDIFGIATGNPVDFVTHQSLGADGILGNGDTFTERITVELLNGLVYNGATYDSVLPQYRGFPPFVPSANLFIDLYLEGAIANYNDGGTATTASNPLSIQDDTFASIFSLGNATMYVDTNNNKTYDGGETVVASFELAAAGPFILTPSVFGGAGAQISFNFRTLSVNTNYFSNAPGYPSFLDSVSNGMHFTLTQGGVAALGGQIAGLTSPDPDKILLGWQETGFDAKFEVVPEPSTMLLMGSGLLGIAFFGRRKFFKKG